MAVWIPLTSPKTAEAEESVGVIPNISTMANHSSNRGRSRVDLDCIVFILGLMIFGFGALYYFLNERPLPFYLLNDTKEDVEKFVKAVWRNDSTSSIFCVQNTSEINAKFSDFKLGVNGCQIQRQDDKDRPALNSENAFVRCDFTLGSLIYSMKKSLHGMTSCGPINQTMTFLINPNRTINPYSIRILDGNFELGIPITSNISIPATNFLTHLAKQRAFKVLNVTGEEPYTSANGEEGQGSLDNQWKTDVDMNFCSKRPKSCSVNES